MRTTWGAVLAAAAASVCCAGPVIAVMVGATTLTAVATRIEPYRPLFLLVAAVLVAVGFRAAYRPVPEAGAQGPACVPASRRRGRVAIWIAAALAGLFAAFPYYVAWLF